MLLYHTFRVLSIDFKIYNAFFTALSQLSPCDIIIEHLFNNLVESRVWLCYDVFDKPR